MTKIHQCTLTEHVNLSKNKKSAEKGANLDMKISTLN